VDGAEPNEDTSTSSRFPTRQFLSLLKFGIKDVDRASPSVKGLKLMAWHLNSCEKISWRNTLSIREVIVDIGCISHGKGPKRAVDSRFPMKGGMKK
jgi:hypothetical protein